jgi:hypothetical protein
VKYLLTAGRALVAGFMKPDTPFVYLPEVQLYDRYACFYGVSGSSPDSDFAAQT